MSSDRRAYSYVRMSSDLQAKGDSTRRQLELSQRYAAEHDLKLVDDEQLADIGISAFKGANVKDGALGRFLKKARSGRIEQGSVLLIESLDRLSRQAVRKSLSIFLDIIDAGITIVTLADKREYTPENTNEFDLIFSLTIMARAHEESRIKSQRVGAAWANKRKHAAERPLTARCPAWLKLSADRTKYEIIKRHADIVKSIFDDSLSGLGKYKITERLNRKRVPPFAGPNGWHGSSVAKILGNRAVIGEFQPHRLLNGKRVPDGDVIKGYFPAIISDNDFFRAQAGRSERAKNGRGRKGASLTNLFSGIAKCANCGSPMKFENKGKPPRGATFLVCDGAKRGLGCEIARWRYDEFEASFLAFVQELKLSDLLENDQVGKVAEIQRTIAGMRGELLSIETQREKTFALLQQVDAASGYVATKLNELENRHREILKEIEANNAHRAAFETQKRSIRDGDNDFKKLMSALKGASGDKLYKLRAQIADRIRSVCVGLYVAPLGPASGAEVAIAVGSDSSAITMLKKEVNAASIGRRFFAVEFPTSMRMVFPNDDDPSKLDMMRYIGPSGPAITKMPDQSHPHPQR